MISDARVLYLFLEIVDLDPARHFFEQVIGLPLIEVEPHMPHHRHGVVKYDGGSLILSLNLAKWPNFDPDASDALVTAVSAVAAMSAAGFTVVSVGPSVNPPITPAGLEAHETHASASLLSPSSARRSPTSRHR